MNFDLLSGAYLLRALGFNAGGFDQDLQGLGGQPDLLSQLRDDFSSCAGHMQGGNQLASALQQGAIPPSMMMPPPNMGQCPCSQMYAQQQAPFGAGLPAQLDMKDLFSTRRKAKKFEKFLKEEPYFRATVEMMLGGRIIEDKKNDGKIKVQPFAGGGFSSNMDPNAMMALASLAQVQQGANGVGFVPGMQQDQAFMGMMLGGLSQMYAGGGPIGGPGGGVPRNANGGSPYVDWADMQQMRNRALAQSQGGGGGRQSNNNPLGGPSGGGANGPNQGAFGISPNGGDEVSAVLSDPTLTVEDKVTLMIMLIMKKMDKDIEKQANYINSLQQQQNGGGAGGGGGGGFPGTGGGAGGGGAEGGSPSIDVETMKLKRLIDKRSQMFDMLRQIIDKYNQTAKGIIDSMGR